jgi:transcriptional regulator with XRE-family HTH domain
MQKPRTWRDLLGSILADSQERQRVAKELGVSAVTLFRWVSGESKPRSHNLRRLLAVLPQHRSQLLPLLEEEFDGFLVGVKEESQPMVLETIPAEFYRQVHHTLPYLPEMLRFSSLSDLILQQALEQLDPHQLGISIIVASCMPPSIDKQIRSLRVRAGRGTSPWSRDLAQEAILLGAESLAGHVVSSGHIEMNQRLSDAFNAAPGYQDDWEESAVAVPIMLCGKIAGSLLVSSTQPDYFHSARHTLVESYAELLALAFDLEDFYDTQLIALWPVPPREVQLQYFSDFQLRVARVMHQHNLTIVKAELQVWQQIEQELFHWQAGDN